MFSSGLNWSKLVRLEPSFLCERDPLCPACAQPSPRGDAPSPLAFGCPFCLLILDFHDCLFIYLLGMGLARTGTNTGKNFTFARVPGPFPARLSFFYGLPCPFSLFLLGPSLPP